MDMDLLALALRECVGRGRDIVLAPNGRASAAVKELMRRDYGLEPRFLVDSYHYDGVTVFSPDALPEGAEECTYLITATREWDRRELDCALRAHVPGDRIVMPEDMEAPWRAVLADPEKVRPDFLGVGFPKCLTTSVYYVLRKNPNVFLTKSKESFFLCGKPDRTRHELYKAEYRGARDTGRLVGEFETQYGSLPRRVHAYHGSDVRLLFFVRDPLKALYSHFKMHMRDVYSDSDIALFREFGHVCPEMYDKWVDGQDRDGKEKFLFGQSLQYYLTYYPREQIHVVLAEELIADTQNRMHALQRFIGLPEEKCVDYPVLPRTNEGKNVSKDYLCAVANNKIHEISRELYGNDALLEEYYNVLRPQLRKHTLVDYSEPPLPETTARLREYYRDDIHLLEELLGRSLQGLWY